MYLETQMRFAEEAVNRRLVSMERVKAWVALRDEAARRGEGVPPIADWMVASGLLTEAERRDVERPLLGTFLRGVRDRLEPVGRAGDSILIYRMPAD
jgi:hypothetical protein